MGNLNIDTTGLIEIAVNLAPRRRKITSALRIFLLFLVGTLFISLAWKIHEGAIDNDVCTAATNGNLAALDTLLNRGANPNAVGNSGEGDDCCGPDNPGQAPALVLAVYKDHVAVSAELLRRGADVNGRAETGLTPLMWAQSKQMATLLLDHGASIDERDAQGFTALMSQAGVPDISELLVRRGANVNIQTKDGTTALMCAADDGDVTLIKLLAEKGVDLNATDSQGETALIHATKSGRISAALALLDCGASPGNEDNTGSTALDYANYYGYSAVTSQIRENAVRNVPIGRS